MTQSVVVQHINLPKELRPLPCSRIFFFWVILKELCLGSDPQNRYIFNAFNIPADIHIE